MVHTVGMSKASSNACFNMACQQHRGGALPQHSLGTLIEAGASKMDIHSVPHTSQSSQTPTSFLLNLKVKTQFSLGGQSSGNTFGFCSLGSKLPEEEISQVP